MKMNTTDAYENLYNNLKNRFTVVSDNCEYTLGDYMLMKAGKKKAQSNLPAVNNASNEKAITAFFKYVNEKLAVKEPPVKDKTIRRFPFRTSAAALLSAVITCTLVLSFGSVTMRSATNNQPATVELTETVEETEDYTYNSQK